MNFEKNVCGFVITMRMRAGVDNEKWQKSVVQLSSGSTTPFCKSSEIEITK